MFWIFLILFYVLITLGTVRVLVQLAKAEHKNRIRLSFYLFAIGLIISMVLLYIWPGDIRTTKNYSLYYYFNGILLLDFIFKIPLSFFFIIGKSYIVVAHICPELQVGYRPGCKTEFNTFTYRSPGVF